MYWFVVHNNGCLDHWIVVLELVELTQATRPRIQGLGINVIIHMYKGTTQGETYHLLSLLESVTKGFGSQSRPGIMSLCICYCGFRCWTLASLVQYISSTCLCLQSPLPCLLHEKNRLHTLNTLIAHFRMNTVILVNTCVIHGQKLNDSVTVDLSI